MLMGTSQITKVDFAVISAMPEEIAYINRVIADGEIVSTISGDFKICNYHGKKVLISAIGMGTTCAAAMATFIATAFQPDYILFTGTAGGIDPCLKVGDVVIGTSAFEAEIQGAFKILPGTAFEGALMHPVKKNPLQPNYSMDFCFTELLANLTLDDLPRGCSIHQGTIATTNTFPSPPLLFQELRALRPLAIDMETSAVYQTAWLLRKKAIVIRGISNILNTEGKEDGAHEVDVSGSSENSAKVLLQILDRLIYILSAVPSIPETAVRYIKQLSLALHPEGGYFREIFKSATLISPANDSHHYFGKQRSAGTSIYYLLAGSDFSAWHRLKSDEIWHYYDGSPLKIYIINHDGELITHILGNPVFVDGAKFQITITANQWFAAEIIKPNSFTLAGCTVSPGFEFSDFELAKREGLSAQFPDHEGIIARLTRASCAHREDEGAGEAAAASHFFNPL